MKLGHAVGFALALALVAGPSAAQLPAFDATKRPVCTDGKPWAVWLLNQSTVTDCDTTAGGSREALCCCEGGSVAACSTSSGGSGTVTSIAVAVPSEWTVSGSPVTTSGTITISEATQADNTFYAGPSAFGPAAPTFRTIADADVPNTITVNLAAAATALAANPADCSTADGTEFAWRINAAGDLSCAPVSYSAASPFDQYDPDRPPTSVGTGGWSEEWTGNAASQTWTWGNQDAATESITYDSALVTGEATADENRIRTTAAATNADQVLSAKMILGENLVSNTNAGCLLVVITAGTQATPTALQFFGTVDAATDVVHSYSDTDLNPSAGASVHASGTAWTEFDYMSSASYLQIRYTDSTRVMTFHISFDGMTWTPIGTVTPAADPLYWGYSVRDHSICRWQFIRLRTDANRNDVGE